MSYINIASLPRADITDTVTLSRAMLRWPTTWSISSTTSTSPRRINQRRLDLEDDLENLGGLSRFFFFLAPFLCRFFSLFLMFFFFSRSRSVCLSVFVYILILCTRQNCGDKGSVNNNQIKKFWSWHSYEILYIHLNINLSYIIVNCEFDEEQNANMCYDHNKTK